MSVRHFTGIGARRTRHTNIKAKGGKGMLTAEVSIYPLKARDPSDVINHSIERLKNTQIDYEVDSVKTHLKGSEEEIFSSLKTMFDSAQDEGGDVSMVVTITNNQ